MNNNVFQNIAIQEISSRTDQRFFIMENIVTGSLVEVNEETAVLVSCLKDSFDKEIGIKTFCAKYGEIEETKVREFIDNKLSKFLDVVPQQTGHFLYNKLIFTSSQVNKISNKLSFLFNKKIGIICFLGSILCNILCLSTYPNLMKFSGNIDANIILGLCVFMLSSSLIHEFGHAAATNKFGLSSGGIGFGLYINFPVFYTDVTQIWRLPKIHKCIVDIAGVYFQLIILVPVIIVHYYTGIEFFKYIILATNFSFILNLNPFFRFDGYWFFSDITEVHNLRKKTRELFKYVTAKIFNKDTGRMPYLLLLKGRVRFWLLIYAIVVNLFMTFYFAYIIPMFMWNFILNIPRLVERLVRYLSCNIMPPFALIQNLISELLFFFMIIFMIYRLGCSFFNGKFKNKPAQ